MLVKGQVLASRYRIVKKISAGGMGAIYEALDTRLDCSVAVKENLLTHRKAAFRREAQILANLIHPSLPRVSDHFTERGKQYLVMELIEGDDLGRILADNKEPFPIPAVLELALQLLDVIDYLHNQPVPILHRDIKPSNLKVRDGRVFLLDFGLVFGQSGEMSTLLKGDFEWDGHSPKYSSPEQMRGERTGPASDLYSLSATLYALLTASPPPSALHRWEQTTSKKPDPLQDIQQCRSDLESSPARAIMRGLALEVKQRPQTACDMSLEMFPLETAPPAEPPKRTFGMAGMAAGVLFTALISLAASTGRTSACHSSTRPLIRSVLRCEISGNQAAQASATVSKDWEQLSAEAREFLYNGDYENAIRKAQEILAQAPDDPYARYIYGDALWDRTAETDEKANQKAEIVEQADRILASLSNPVTANDFTARAWANLVKQRIELAIADAESALRLNAGSVGALMISATAKGMSAATNPKRARAALSDYDEVIRLRPNYATAWANRAWVLAALQKHEIAISNFGAAIRLKPQAAFYLGQAASFRSLHQNKAAAQAYREALRINSNCYAAYEGLAELEAQNENWNSSISYYSMAIQIQPTTKSLYGRGYAYSQVEKVQKAIQDLTQAIDLDRTDYRSRGLRAYCYARLMKWDQATSDYTKALRGAPAADREFLKFVYESRAEAFRQSGKTDLSEN